MCEPSKNICTSLPFQEKIWWQLLRLFPRCAQLEHSHPHHDNETGWRGLGATDAPSFSFHKHTESETTHGQLDTIVGGNLNNFQFPSKWFYVWGLISRCKKSSKCWSRLPTRTFTTNQSSYSLVRWLRNLWIYR